MDAFHLTCKLVRKCLQLNESVPLEHDTYLMGNFPEFNSLTVATMITEIEEQTGSDVDDDEISGDIFETIGSLTEFVKTKMDSA